MLSFEEYVLLTQAKGVSTVRRGRVRALGASWKEVPAHALQLGSDLFVSSILPSELLRVPMISTEFLAQVAGEHASSWRTQKVISCEVLTSQYSCPRYTSMPLDPSFQQFRV